MSKLSEFYRAHERAVRARCRILLGDAAAAEDATQETFLRVQRHLDEAVAVDDVRAWILRIASNYCLNELRNHALARKRVLELPYVEGVSTEEGLLARDLLRSLLRELPESLQTIVSLHYFFDLPQGRIAGELGISRRTVVNRMADLHRGLKRWQHTALESSVTVTRREHRGRRHWPPAARRAAQPPPERPETTKRQLDRS